jgi:crotonobetainyl-CoA:carnitine CoA-transferase CaiB-like acyl-CoA transferase
VVDSALPRGPLQGVRVIDLTAVLMGPSATQMLGDLGADVIKVETAGGDHTRGLGPGAANGLGPIYLGLNRNKRSIVLDLKNPQGMDVMKRLLKDADVLASNVRPAGMARLGLTWEALSELNPRLVFVSMVGFSQRGRYAAQPAFDDVIQAATGLPTMLAESIDGVPRYVPLNLADRSVGLHAFGIICAALFARERTGRGQKVDVPMFETMVPYVLGDHFWGEKFVPPQAGFGYPRLTTRERVPQRTADGFVCCTIYTDQQWRSFLGIIGHPEWWDKDARFRSSTARTMNSDFLNTIIRDEMIKHSTQEWHDLLGSADIPVFPMHTFDTLIQDPHLQDIGFFSEVEHPQAGIIRETSVPSEWADSPPGGYRHAPSLGEHTTEILSEVGLSPAEIAALFKCGAVAGWQDQPTSKNQPQPVHPK